MNHDTDFDAPEYAVHRTNYTVTAVMRDIDGNIVGYRPLTNEEMTDMDIEVFESVHATLNRLGYYTTDAYLLPRVKEARAKGSTWDQFKIELAPKQVAKAWTVWQGQDKAERDAVIAAEFRTAKAEGLTWTAVAGTRWTGARRTALKALWDATAAGERA